MSTARAPGRKAVDGVTGVTERVNLVLTEQHRKKLEKLAPNGFSAWVRNQIDSAWAQHTKGVAK